MATEGLATFCWFELATTNSAAAAEFYRELFGWQGQATPLPGGMTYTILRLGDQDVGATYDMTPATGAGHLPPHWASYVLVEDVDAKASQVKELGGTLMKEPFDVMDIGRMAIFRDPTGGMLCIWQAKSGSPRAHIDYTQAGRVCWCELQTRGARKAADFYAELFGWKLGGKDGGDYIQFFHEDSPLGGFFELNGKTGLEGVPPNWMVFFATDDVDQSSARVKELGGRVHMPPMDLPDVGRFAVVSDPQGATFTLFRLNPDH